MSLLDNYPYFNNFILDGLVLLLSIGFAVIAFAGIYFGATILYVVLRGLWEWLTNTKKRNASSEETQVLFFGKEPKKPNDYE